MRRRIGGRAESCWTCKLAGVGLYEQRAPGTRAPLRSQDTHTARIAMRQTDHITHASRTETPPDISFSPWPIRAFSGAGQQACRRSRPTSYHPARSQRISSSSLQQSFVMSRRQNWWKMTWRESPGRENRKSTSAWARVPAAHTPSQSSSLRITVASRLASRRVNTAQIL